MGVAVGHNLNAFSHIDFGRGRCIGSSHGKGDNNANQNESNAHRCCYIMLNHAIVVAAKRSDLNTRVP